LPAAASPFPSCGGGVVTVVVDGVTVVSPAAELSFSLPNTSTAGSIPTTKRAESATNQPTLRPGEVGVRRGRTLDEVSAEPMKRPPTTARPIFWPDDNPATTSDVDSIAAETTRTSSWPSQASAGADTAGRTATRRSLRRRTVRRTRPRNGPSGRRRAG